MGVGGTELYDGKEGEKLILTTFNWRVNGMSFTTVKENCMTNRELVRWVVRMHITVVIRDSYACTDWR